MSRPGVFYYTAVFNGKVFQLGRFVWDYDTATSADVWAGVAQGFRQLAENFDFAEIMEGYGDDGEETDPGGNDPDHS